MPLDTPDPAKLPETKAKRAAAHAKAARKARNPRTGDKVFVPEKFVVTFKPGKEMEERVREMERRAAEQAGFVPANGSAGAESPSTPTI